MGSNQPQRQCFTAMPPSTPVFEPLPENIALQLGISNAATISQAPQGMTSEVAFVNDHGRESVVKRCRNPIYIEWLRREQRVLVALSECSLRIPRVIGYHEVRQDTQVVDAWLHMTRLPGESLWHVLLGSPIDRSDRLWKVGNLLRELHAVSPPEAFRHQRPWIDRMLEQARRNLEWCDGSAELLADLEATQPVPSPEVLIHGDLALDNVLIDDDSSMGLIDWSGGDFGDPRYDIALTLATEPEIHLRDVEVAAFFDGYQHTRIDAATMRWFMSLYEFF
jgi:aminoglycoside phosphotransferase (APT) family kinase protein